MIDAAPSSSKLPRTLGLWSSVALVVGITIGSGIFRSPAGIAQKVPSPTLMLTLWIAGGLITLCGALSLAELAAALPETIPFDESGLSSGPMMIFERGAMGEGGLGACPAIPVPPR